MLLRFSRLFNVSALLITGTMVLALGVITSLLLREPLLWQFASGLFAVLLFLRYPYLLLLAWIVVNPLIGSPLPFFNGQHFLTDLIVPSLLFLCFIPYRKVLRYFPVLVLLLLFLLWILASLAVSPLGHETFLTLWLADVQYATVAVLALVVLKTRFRLLRLLDILLLFEALVVVYGIYNYLTGQGLIYDHFTALPRLVALFGSAPTLAMFLSVGIPLALYRVLTLQGLRRLVPALLGCVLVVGVVLSDTRSAEIALPLGLLILFFCIPSLRIRVGLFVGLGGLLLGCVLLATIGHVPLFARFFNGDILTLNGRTYLWQAVLTHFDPANLLGTGLRGSDILLTRLQVRDQYGVIGTAAHSIFLETLYDHGIIGLLLLLALLVTLLVTLLKGLRSSRGERRLLFATALAIFISVLLQSIQSNDVLTDLPVGSYFWIAMALPFVFAWHMPTGSAATATAEGSAEEASSEQEGRTEMEGATAGSLPGGEHLRVCILSLGFWPLVGGSEKQAERHARTLLALGHEVLVVTLRREKRWAAREVVADLPIVRVGGVYDRNGRLRIGRLAHVISDLTCLFALLRLRRRYDLIHVFQVCFPAGVAALVGYLLEKPVIIGVQSSGSDDARFASLTQSATLMLDTLPPAAVPTLRLKFMDWATNAGDIAYLPYAGIGGRSLLRSLRHSQVFFHVLSVRSYTYLVSHGFSVPHIVCIPNGVDTAFFQPAWSEEATPVQVADAEASHEDGTAQEAERALASEDVRDALEDGMDQGAAPPPVPAFRMQKAGLEAMEGAATPGTTAEEPVPLAIAERDSDVLPASEEVPVVEWKDDVGPGLADSPEALATTAQRAMVTEQTEQTRSEESRPQRRVFRVVCVARMEYAKGVDVLLHAWSRLMQDQSAWGEQVAPLLQLAGEGALRPQMEWIAQQLGLEASVQFLGTRTDVLDLLQHASAFVLPSRWEGLPNALLEAMACGLPCVATRVSGSEDVVVDGVNGLLVEPEEPQALAEALRSLLLETELTRRLCREARTTMLQGYQLSYIVRQSLTLYHRLLAEARVAQALAGRNLL